MIKNATLMDGWKNRKINHKEYVTKYKQKRDKEFCSSSLNYGNQYITGKYEN